MKNFSTFLVFAFLFCCVNFSYAQRNCGAMEYLEDQLQQNPRLQFNMDQIESQTQHFIKRGGDLQKAVITIPIVVHVVYNNSSENISNAKIQSQIDVLNEDFRRLNADKINTPSIFAGVAADVEIEFCLATVDPNGNATTGITRTSTSKRSFQLNDDMKKSNKGGKDPWPAGDYLNMWVCDIASGYLGYAQFPGGNPATDGVVIDYAYFGTGSSAPYDLGRTATHEVGHWLNLRHIWGDGGCGVDDFVSDTPVAGGPNYTGSPCTFPGPNTCNEGAGDLPDMFQNYMDYSDDACMNLFTNGQTSRMRALFGAGGARASLLASNGCGNGGGGGPTCSDGIQNGSETGVDCGGPDCAPCSGGSCAAPTNLSSTPKNRGRRATLAWSAVSGANNYTVTIQRIAPTTGSVSSTTTSSTSLTASGLTNGSTYEWTVTANCSSGSNTATATFVAGQAGKLSQQTDDLLVYPNPATDKLMVVFQELTIAPELTFQTEVNTSKDYILQVTDVYGRTLQRHLIGEGAETMELNVANLQQGIYFLRMTDKAGEEIAIKRFLVQK